MVIIGVTAVVPGLLGMRIQECTSMCVFDGHAGCFGVLVKYGMPVVHAS